MGRGTLEKARDGSGDTLGGPRDTLKGSGQVGKILGRSGTGRGTLGEVRDGSWDPRGGPGRVG